jgi:diguanylate cyclase (GGDEF)-like protein
MVRQTLTAFSNRGLRDVFTSRHHSVEVSRERYTLIVSRVQWSAGLFAVLMAAWIIVDALTVSWPLWGVIGIERLFAAAAFLMLARHRFAAGPASAALWAVATFVFVLAGFFSLSYVMFWHFHDTGQPLFATTAYFYAPFLISGGLSILPLTALESALLTMPLFAATALSLVLSPEPVGGGALATLWHLFLVAGISNVASMSQLRFLIALVEQFTLDAMTNALTRSSGEHVIDSQFALAASKGSSLAVLFIDLDRFKTVNDRFGHEAGDAVLQRAGRSIRASLRDQDTLVRWGGEEFLAILPGLNAIDAEAVVKRMGRNGFGVRPDGTPVTASIGIAERISDKTLGWAELVDLADKRMYAGKMAGRNRYMNAGGKTACFVARNAIHAIKDRRAA